MNIVDEAGKPMFELERLVDRLYSGELTIDEFIAERDEWFDKVWKVWKEMENGKCNIS